MSTAAQTRHVACLQAGTTMMIIDTSSSSDTNIYLITMDLGQSMDDVKTNGGNVLNHSKIPVSHFASCEDDQQGMCFSLHHEPNDKTEEHAKSSKGQQDWRFVLLFSSSVGQNQGHKVLRSYCLLGIW
jgi:hypothetical protein